VLRVKIVKPLFLTTLAIFLEIGASSIAEVHADNIGYDAGYDAGKRQAISDFSTGADHHSCPAGITSYCYGYHDGYDSERAILNATQDDAASDDN
jgi:hypothetical protein